MPEILTTDQLATKLGGVHENTLARWRDEGMPFYPRGTGYVYQWDEVADWLTATKRDGYRLTAETEAQ